MSAVDLLQEAAARTLPALEAVLQRIVDPRPSDGVPGAHAIAPDLEGAMRYALTSGGKRLRPALAFGGAHAVGAPLDDALPAACAVEMVHTYSLVHDDLPCMDDDDERRGKPSTHKQYDEPTALLAGDALLTEALGLLAEPRPLGEGRPVSAEVRAQAVVELARAVGAAGMVAGQQDDLTSELAGRPATSRDAILSIHQRKTGRLITAAVVLGGLFGGADAAQLEGLRRFGQSLGLAFQLVDDALDGDGLAALEGAEAAREEARVHTRYALEAAEGFGPAGAPLAALARRMLERVT